MPNSGLLISCATVAASLPMEAIFSRASSELVACAPARRSCAAPAPRSWPARRPPRAVILLKEAARSPSSSSRAHRQAVIQVAVRHAVRAVDQLLHRPVDHPPDEDHAAPARSSPARCASEPAQVRLVLRDLRVHRGQRQIGVDHAQHPLAGRCTWQPRWNIPARCRWAGSRPAGARPAVREDARAVRPVELHQRRALRVAAVAGLGALVHHPVDLRARRWRT